MARGSRQTSPESQSLVEEIRRLLKKGHSVREVARRTELSKSHVHNIAIGKRGVSPTRAAAATERLSRERSAFAFIDGQMLAVDPLTQSAATRRRTFGL